MKVLLHILILSIYLGLFTLSSSAKIKDDKQNFQAICVDYKNTIWVGTSQGLYYWNSGELKKVKVDSALNITEIFCFQTCLILGTADGELLSYSNQYDRLQHEANVGSAISKIAYSSNTLYVATKGNGLFAINELGINHFTKQKGLNDNYLYQLVQDSLSRLWIASDNGLNMITKEGELKQSNLSALCPDPILSALNIQGNKLVIGTQQGDLGTIKFGDTNFTFFNKEKWGSEEINDILLLDEHIVIATNQGAYLLDWRGNIATVLEDKIPIYKIVIDQEGNLWCIGNHLLSSHLGEQLILFDSLKNNSCAFVHTMHSIQNSGLWFTPDQGLFNYEIQKDSLLKYVITPPELLVDITAIHSDHKGFLWVGTSGKGLYRMNLSTRKIQHIPIENSIESAGIISIQDDEHTLFVSSLNGVWYTSLDSEQYVFSSLEEKYHLKKYIVYQVEIDHRGNIWLATDGQGLVKIIRNQLKNKTFISELSKKAIYGVEEDSLHQIWMNVSQEGLYCLKADSLIHLTTDQGLTSNDIVSMQSFSKDYVVAVTNKSIDLINIHSFQITHVNYEGYLFNFEPEVNSITSDESGHLFVGGNKGILMFTIPSAKKQLSPLIEINKIEVMGEKWALENSNFSYDENYFRFELRSKNNSADVTYIRYKLEGLNDLWTNIQSKEIVFPRLNPGKYNLIVQCANNRKFLNPNQTNYSFKIQNPFWKKWWFVLGFISLLLALIYNYIRFREERVGRIQQLEKEKAIAEFETLKHQVSPHFLFNSFNTLIQVIDEDKNKAIEYTQKLSDFYRSLISYRDIDLVPLKEELELLENYIYLQKMRFGDSLKLSIHCKPTEIVDLEIPPLTLQLLAENAIKHNSIKQSNPLELEIKIQGKFLSILNNLNLKSNPEEGEKLGIQNIKNRYKLFSDTSIVIIHSNTQFEVKLPLLYTTL